MKINKCQCGWLYLGNKQRCPQCRFTDFIQPKLKLCVCCAEPISHTNKKKYCIECWETITKMRYAKKHRAKASVDMSIRVSDFIFNQCGLTIEECLKCEKVECVL